MSRIFLINVGANSAHKSVARCPLFADGTFIFVPFPLAPGQRGKRPYPEEARPFTNGVSRFQTHADPDWPNLTYGDFVRNARAAALKSARAGDILLFWSLLWHNTGDSWRTFTNLPGWYLIGALSIDEILSRGQSARDAKPENQIRASFNAHFYSRKLNDGDMVFIGDRKRSALFPRAVPLVTTRLRPSLLYRAFRTKDGSRLPLQGKHWSGYTRSCRAVWDLYVPAQRKLAAAVSEAIQRETNFDLLAGL